MGVTNEQLYLALAAPVLSSAVTIAILVAYINSQVGSLRSDMNERFHGIDERFQAMNQRFDDMRDLWRAELRRVEEVLDQRLQRLER